MTAEQPSVEALVEQVRQTLNRGSYDPQAAGWRAFFDDVSRDDALAALDSLTAALERAERERDALDGWFTEQKRLRHEAEARAQKAEAERDEWRDTAQTWSDGCKRAEAEKQILIEEGDVILAQLRTAEAVVEAARYECEHLGGSEGLLNAVARYDEPPTV